MDISNEEAYTYLDHDNDDDFSGCDEDDFTEEQDVNVDCFGCESESESEFDEDVDNGEEDEDVDNREEDVDVHASGFNYKVLMDYTANDIRGLQFSNEDECYRFYYTYARFHGFGIRKDEVAYDADGNIVMRQYLCNKAGLRDKKHFMRVDRKKDHRPLTRTNCDARFRVRLNPETSKWEVITFVESHNHWLCDSNFVSLIRTYRGLCDADKAQVDCLHAVGVRTCHIMGYMMDQNGGHIGLAFHKKDLFNHIERSRRSKIKDGDVLAALSYLQGKADNDPMFFSKYVIGDNGNLNHLFWADGTSRCDFQCFGDVLAFDTTYKKNKYNKPLVIFSGKNHHGQSVIFGCALVSDESTETYKWVLEAFLDAMCHKYPKAVVTDGDGAMREAIKHVFPNARHRLCGWHLQKNAVQNVKNRKFLKDFQKVLYGNFCPEKFENLWEALVAKHHLEANNWIWQTYEKRELWANAYLRDKFFGGIRTTSMCEGINSCIKSYLRRKNTIVEVLYNMERSLRDFRYNELLSDFNTFYTQPVLTTSLLDLEKEAAKLFTKEIFKKVKSEIVTAGGMNVVDRSENEEKVVFKVDRFGKRSSEREVVFDKQQCTFVCDCMKFESSGIPCSHTICAMRLDHITSFPESLICKRWLKDAKSSFMRLYEPEDKANEMMIMARFGVLAAACNTLCKLAAKKCDNFNTIRNEILKLTEKIQKPGGMSVGGNGLENKQFDPNVVKTKGAPRKKIWKNKKRRRCSNCNEVGHIITTCPIIRCVDEDLSGSGDSLSLEANSVEGSDEEAINSTKINGLDTNVGQQSHGVSHKKKCKLDAGGGCPGFKAKKDKSRSSNTSENKCKNQLKASTERANGSTNHPTGVKDLSYRRFKNEPHAEGKSQGANGNGKLLREKNDFHEKCTLKQSKKAAQFKSITKANNGSTSVSAEVPHLYQNISSKPTQQKAQFKASPEGNYQTAPVVQQYPLPGFNGTMSSLSPAQGMLIPPVYGVFPVYNQFPQGPILPVANSIPMAPSYPVIQNGSAGSQWCDLLQEMMKGAK